MVNLTVISKILKIISIVFIFTGIGLVIQYISELEGLVGLELIIATIFLFIGIGIVSLVLILIGVALWFLAKYFERREEKKLKEKKQFGTQFVFMN